MIPQLEVLGYAIPTYLLTLSIVYCIGIFYFFKRLARFSLNPNVASDILLLAMVLGFIGARVFYIIYQEPDYYMQNPFEILQFWHGGFVYYGGFLTAMLACFMYLKRKNENLGLWMDAAAPVLALGYGLGRLACFFNGCCYGAVCTLPWAIQFPHLHGERHPTQIYAVAFELSVWALLLLLERKVTYKFKTFGMLFYTWIVAHGIGRIVMELFRDDPRGEKIFGFTISTCISLILIAWGTIRLIQNIKTPTSSNPTDTSTTKAKNTL